MKWLEEKLEDRGFDVNTINDLIVLFRGDYNRYIFLGYSKETFEKIFFGGLDSIDTKDQLALQLEKRLNIYFRKHIKLQAKKQNIIILDNLLVSLKRQTSDAKTLLKLFWRELEFYNVKLDQDYFEKFKDDSVYFKNLIDKLGISDFSLEEFKKYVNGKYDKYIKLKPQNMTIRETVKKVRYYNNTYGCRDYELIKLLLNNEKILLTFYNQVMALDKMITIKMIETFLINSGYEFVNRMILFYNECMIMGQSSKWDEEVLKFYQKVEIFRNAKFKEDKTALNLFLLKARLDDLDKDIPEKKKIDKKSKINKAGNYGNLSDILLENEKEEFYAFFKDEREISWDLKVRLIDLIFGELSEDKQQIIFNYLKNKKGDRAMYKKALTSLKNLYEKEIFSKTNFVLYDVIFIANYELKIGIIDDLKFDNIDLYYMTLKMLGKELIEKEIVGKRSFKKFYQGIIREVLTVKRLNSVNSVILACIKIMEEELGEKIELILKK